MPSSMIRRGIWAIGAAVIVVALVVAALPLIASTRIVRDRIAWEMSAWSGFRVAIDGSPRIEVWPTFRAILTDVTLSQWTDTEAPPVVEAERVEVDLSAMAALRGDVVFSTARLVRPTIRVQRTPAGLFLPAVPTGGRITRSIDTARGLVNADPAKPDLDKLPTDTFGTVEFRDGRMVASIGGKDVEILSSLNGQANWAAMNSNATLSATGIWRGESVALDVASAKPLVLFAGGTAPLTLSFKAAPATFSFDGTASMSENTYFDGQAKFSAPSLRRVLEWSQAGIAPGAAIGSVSISSKITATGGRVKFDNTAIALDNNPGMGALDLSLGEAQPVISGTLAFDTLDLRSFLSAFTPLVPTGGAGPGEIDTSFADKINLDLRLSAAHATAGPIQLADVAATAQVKDGLSVFDISDASAFGGNIQTSLRFDRKPEGSQVEIRLLASDIDGGAFGTAAGMTRLVPVGTGTVSVILKGPGRTWDSIFDNADGSVSATFGPGALSKLNLPAFLKHTEQGGFFALDDVSDATLPIDGAEIKATISKGVARIDKAEANSAKYKIWLSGIASYAGRGLALSGGVIQPDQAATQANGQQGPNQSSFFVGGTWSTPFISPISRGVSGE
ncbi:MULTISPECIES: AsmA family protein [Mesorhizobium]|uniref:AsmA family protein n=13 Tax=Mesorhizobium TaxID=68287 RepID=A0AB38T9X7_9HYPH|nr:MULTISPECIES: AsmA family protein [Mesorhizobium]RUZ92070.1 AsmA family protein [Mesorhizobium sp. M7A.F.Ca.US.003.02.2.1]AMX96798.1 membrane assembly protein AsmA [Mesorhizobium ciceri]ARP64140.1 AsmA family protein [Mesorhizobium sp. WSM1497]MBZ9891778.1 AsmA family protein [Mesorhizobium sp. BR1-1-3]MDF3206337.1 AsmA family protein [Mesorhizobium sp. LMG15046]